MEGTSRRPLQLALLRAVEPRRLLSCPRCERIFAPRPAERAAERLAAATNLEPFVPRMNESMYVCMSLQPMMTSP